LLREGAQDVLVKSELECAPLARAIRYAIERQRSVSAARASAYVDPLTGVLTRDAFLNVACLPWPPGSLALVEIPADRETLDPILIQAADALRRVFEAPAALGRWDRRRFCVLAPEAALHRAAELSSTARCNFPSGVSMNCRTAAKYLFARKSLCWLIENRSRRHLQPGPQSLGRRRVLPRNPVRPGARPSGSSLPVLLSPASLPALLLRSSSRQRRRRLLGRIARHPPICSTD
jgi:GGDEF domain-containing protein